MGNTCMRVVDSFRYMAEPINIVKFKNKIKKKDFWKVLVNCCFCAGVLGRRQRFSPYGLCARYFHLLPVTLLVPQKANYRVS